MASDKSKTIKLGIASVALLLGVVLIANAFGLFDKTPEAPPPIEQRTTPEQMAEQKKADQAATQITRKQVKGGS